VGDAGSGSGIPRLRRKIPLLFGEESLKTVCFDSFNFKTGSYTDAQFKKLEVTGVAEWDAGFPVWGW